jgi:hypothetical protein
MSFYGDYFGSYFGVPGTSTPVTSDHYGSEAGMRRLIAANLDIFGDLDASGAIDDGIVEDVLTRADSYIRRTLKAEPHKVTPPLPANVDAGDADVASSLHDLGDHMGVWFIAHDRGLVETAPGQTSSANSIAGGVGGYKTYVDEELIKLASLIAETETGDSPLASGSPAGALTAVVGSPLQYPGMGRVRPAAIVVPSIPSTMGSW